MSTPVVYWHVVYAAGTPVAAFADKKNAEAVSSAFPEVTLVRRRLSSLGRDLEKFARAKADIVTVSKP